MIFPRIIQKKIERQINTEEIVVLTGMRRVGKTTLYRAIYEQIDSTNKAFLDIENPLEQKLFEETDYNNIWANLRAYQITPEKKAYLFLDEIQAMPKIVPAIKYLYDHYQVKFFVTGSSSFYLKNLFPESLAGRKIVFELFPLTFEEFLIFNNVSQMFYYTLKEKEEHKNFIVFEKTKKLYDEFLEHGGFPQVVLASSREEKRSKLEDIVKSYFEKDVRILTDFRDINLLRDLILLLAQRAGNKLEIAKLASELGSSRETIYSYLAFLSGTYFISLISPYSRNVDREVSGTKKIYFCDSGLVNMLGKLSAGILLEQGVFSALRHLGKVNYYQKRSGAEIDFVINEKIGIEVKQTYSPYDLRRLAVASKRLGLSEYYLVSQNFSPDKSCIPASAL